MLKTEQTLPYRLETLCHLTGIRLNDLEEAFAGRRLLHQAHGDQLKRLLTPEQIRLFEGHRAPELPYRFEGLGRPPKGHRLLPHHPVADIQVGDLLAYVPPDDHRRAEGWIEVLEVDHDDEDRGRLLITVEAARFEVSTRQYVKLARPVCTEQEGGSDG